MLRFMGLQRVGLNEHESEQTPEVGDAQGSLACGSLSGLKESNMTE